ncbi:Na+/H+ antiporter subunit E [Bauldia sp.]|uniref:Na+/H+ antiporter subunit E n=1 Tax=Bauldia sp. TaxID=2575872 RepID=UPI003BAD10AF
MLRTISLAVSLFIFWLLLSGLYTAWFISLGFIIAVVIALFGRSFGYADEEGHPAELVLPGLLYWPWLAVQIVKSTLNVARIILTPSLPVSPKLIGIRPTQKTAVGMATYANSITLTPATISAKVDRNAPKFVVHALTEASAAEVEGGEMDRRVTAFEGSR